MRKPEAAAGPALQLPPITPRRAGGETPLSFVQERYWLEQRFSPDQATHNVPVFFRLRGPLDVFALRGAVEGLLRRHQVLRGRIVETGGQPGVRVAPYEGLRLEEKDLRGAANPGEQIQALLLELLDAPFDLARSPLMRADLYRQADDEWVLALVFHQSVFDSLSDPVLRRELGADYGELAAGRPAATVAPVLQYGDFAAWQRRELAGRLEGAAEHWRSRLSGLPEPLSWPADRRRPLVPSRRGAQILGAFGPELRDLLARRGAELGIDKELLVLAALAALLARVGPHGFVTIGLPVALRPPELEPLIGNFDNLVVLAARLAGNPSFRSIAAQVAAEEAQVRGAGFFPYEQLVEALRPERAPESDPFFRVFFQRLPAGHRDFALHGLEIGRLSPPVRRSRHDLEITLIDGGSRGVAISVVYSVDLFDRATAERFAESFFTLLESALEDPARRLSELATMPPATRLALEDAARGRRMLWPREESLVELFESWADARRSEVAAVYGRDRRTYGELDHAATRLARQLVARGVAPGEVVGLCCPRSPDLIAACLAILKAGAVVAPLDPEDPPLRLRRMLEKSGARTLVAHPRISWRLESWPRDLLLLEEVLPTGEAERLPRLACRESGAMLFFTSGSTGEPKGVLLSHHNLIRLIVALGELDLPPGLTFGQLSSFTFDAVAFELWGAFAGGGKLVGIERETAANAAALRAQLERDGIDVLLVTSAAFHHLARQNPRVFADLPLVLFGGERADAELVRQVLREGPPRRLVHAYGPTEATTFATLHEIRHLSPEATTVPIGRPLAETTVHVFDRLGQPAPVGVPGELYLGGPALARGYQADPAAAAAVFLPHGEPGEPGERLYKSGDLARWGQRLELEFVGRADQQVKIGGVRIELGEVESALGQHPAVAQKVVVLQNDAAGLPHLVAFVVPQPAAAAPGGRELRAFLRQRLPEFMVPAAVLLLGVLPMTPHGKVDRRSLPHFTLLDNEDEAMPGPRDEVEIVLERLWCEVMGADHVAIEANFFDLGGHSLLATQVLAKVRAAFGVDLPLREVFRAPTIAQMAELVRQARSGGHHLAPPPLHRWPEPHPLSAMQERRFHALALQPVTSERSSTLAAELRGPLDEVQLLRALLAVAQRAEALRSTVRREEDGRLCWQVAPAIDLPLEREDLRERLLGGDLDAAVEASLAVEAARPFAPQGLFWRCRLIVVGPQHHVLAITVHRLLFDAASERLLWANLAAAYAAGRRGLDLAGGEPPVGPGDWSAHRRRWLVGEVREAMLRPWRALLEKAPREQTGPFRTEILRQDLPPTVTRAIRGLAQRHHCPPTTVALAAWCALLAREQRGESPYLFVASSLDGRHYPELERILGSFESKVLLRIDTRAGSFPALLQQVQQAQRFALDHRDLSFAELIQDLAPDADPRQDPFCTTSFRWLTGNLPAFDQVATRYLPVHGGWEVHARELCIVELPQAWRAELTYSGDRAVAEGWLREFMALLLRAAAT